LFSVPLGSPTLDYFDSALYLREAVAEAGPSFENAAFASSQIPSEWTSSEAVSNSQMDAQVHGSLSTRPFEVASLTSQYEGGAGYSMPVDTGTVFGEHSSHGAALASSSARSASHFQPSQYGSFHHLHYPPAHGPIIYDSFDCRMDPFPAPTIYSDANLMSLPTAYRTPDEEYGQDAFACYMTDLIQDGERQE
jgi:hypothetical protein